MAGEAQASTITIGSVLPPGSTPTEFGQVQTLFNSALPEKGANLTSPVNGAIVRWRVQGATGGPFTLRVLRPNNSGGYQASGTSNPAMPTNSGLQTFSANLKVEAGDLVGVDPANAADKIGVAEVAGANYGSSSRLRSTARRSLRAGQWQAKRSSSAPKSSRLRRSPRSPRITGRSRAARK
jgi:hypothetical protein